MRKMNIIWQIVKTQQQRTVLTLVEESLSPSQPATVARKVEALSEHVHVAYTFLPRLALICMLSRGLLTKNSASEIRRKFIKVGWVLSLSLSLSPQSLHDSNSLPLPIGGRRKKFFSSSFFLPSFFPTSCKLVVQ